jgi:hypothetical protein
MVWAQEIRNCTDTTVAEREVRCAKADESANYRRKKSTGNQELWLVGKRRRGIPHFLTSRRQANMGSRNLICTRISGRFHISCSLFGPLVILNLSVISWIVKVARTNPPVIWSTTRRIFNMAETLVNPIHPSVAHKMDPAFAEIYTKHQGPLLQSSVLKTY